MRTRRLGIAIPAAFLALAGLALTGCSSGTGSAGGGDAGGGGGGGLDTLTVATVAGSQGDAALSLAADKGIFKKAGFTLERKTVKSAPAALAAAQSGQVDIAYAPSIPVLNAISHGVSLHIVMAADGYAPDTMTKYKGKLSEVDGTSFYASKKSGITKVSQLKGKTISLPAKGGQFDVVVKAMLKSHGVDPDSVKWIVLNYQSALTALKKGEIQAAPFVQPFGPEAKAAGMTYLGPPSVGFFQHGAVGLWSCGDKLAQDTKRVKAFQKLIVEANTYANAHVDEAKQKSIDITGADLKPSDMPALYWSLTVKKSDIQRVDDALVDLGFLKKPVDLSGVILPQPE